MNHDSTNGFSIVPRYLLGTLTALELAAYVSLVSHTDEFGMCWPSHSLIAKESGMSTMSARRAVASLAEKGVLSVEHRTNDIGGQTSNHYLVRVWRNGEYPPVLPEHGGCPERTTNENH